MINFVHICMESWGKPSNIASSDPDLVLSEARRLDQIPLEQRGPLHGVPVGIKDVMDTKGTTRCLSVVGRAITHRMCQTCPRSTAPPSSKDIGHRVMRLLLQFYEPPALSSSVSHRHTYTVFEF